MGVSLVCPNTSRSYSKVLVEISHVEFVADDGKKRLRKVIIFMVIFCQNIPL